MATKSYYIGNNKANEVALLNSNDLIVVRNHEKVNEDFVKNQITSVFSHFPINYKCLSYFPESNVYVFKFLSKNTNNPISKELRDEILTALKRKTNVLKYAGKSLKLKNANIYQIYTENLFLKFRNDAKERHIKSVLKKFKLFEKRKLKFCTNGYFVESANGIGQDVFDQSIEILNLNEVNLCHPETVVKRKGLKQNFNAFYTNKKFDGVWARDKVKADVAWKNSTGKDINICIIDDGIDFDHPVFKNKIKRSKDMHNEKKDAYHKFDEEKHGTACASIAAGNDENFKGIAPDSNIIPIRTKSLGSVLEADAFYWAALQNADIISCSWGPPDGSIYKDNDDKIEYPIPDHTRLAIDYAATKGRNGKGCIIVFAAGNGKEPIEYDGYASHKNVISVGAANKIDLPTVYSDYGSPIFCVFPSGDFTIESKNKISRAYGLRVADRIGQKGYVDGDYFDVFQGTSASSPGVAGITALVLSVNPNLSSKQVKSILKNSCETIGNQKNYKNKGGYPYSELYGYGMLRADLAVENTIKYTNIQNQK